MIVPLLGAQVHKSYAAHRNWCSEHMLPADLNVLPLPFINALHSSLSPLGGRVGAHEPPRKMKYNGIDVAGSEYGLDGVAQQALAWKPIYGVPHAAAR